MQPIVSSSDRAGGDAVAFITELIRLQGEVEEVGRQLERIEDEMRQTLNDAARERFEEQG